MTMRLTPDLRNQHREFVLLADFHRRFSQHKKLLDTRQRIHERNLKLSERNIQNTLGENNRREPLPALARARAHRTNWTTSTLHAPSYWHRLSDSTVWF